MPDDQITKLMVSFARMEEQLKAHDKKAEQLCARLERLEGVGSRRWERIIEGIIGALIAGLMGGFLVKIIG